MAPDCALPNLHVYKKGGFGPYSGSGSLQWIWLFILTLLLEESKKDLLSRFSSQANAGASLTSSTISWPNHGQTTHSTLGSSNGGRSANGEWLLLATLGSYTPG